MDDSKVTLGDDEFHFSEAEEASSDPYTLADDAAEPKTSKFSRRNILIAVGIVVVALSLYKLIGVFFGASDAKKTSTVATAATPTKSDTVVKDQAALNKIVSQDKEPAVQITTQPVHTKQMQSQLSQMQETDVAHSQQMQQVSSQLSSLSESVRSLNQSVQSMSQALQSVSSQLQSQQMSIAALKVKPQSRSVGRTSYKRVYRPVPRWYVQAIIPGRAWLIQSNGNTTTVNVGDVLKGYGKIKAISVINSTVKLSSGAILTYKGG